MSVLGIGLGTGLVLLSDARAPVDVRSRIFPLGNEIPDRLYAELAVAALIIGLAGLGNLVYYSMARCRKPEK